MKGLIKTLIKPDWDDTPKRTEILSAANLLQIGEFQLIQLAYKVWYSEDLPEEKINNILQTTESPPLTTTTPLYSTTQTSTSPPDPPTTTIGPKIESTTTYQRRQK